MAYYNPCNYSSSSQQGTVDGSDFPNNHRLDVFKTVNHGCKFAGFLVAINSSSSIPTRATTRILTTGGLPRLRYRFRVRCTGCGARRFRAHPGGRGSCGTTFSPRVAEKSPVLLLGNVFFFGRSSQDVQEKQRCVIMKSIFCAYIGNVYIYIKCISVLRILGLARHQSWELMLNTKTDLGPGFHIVWLFQGSKKTLFGIV